MFKFFSSLPARIFLLVLVLLVLGMLASYYFMTRTALDDSLELLLQKEREEVVRLAARVDSALDRRAVLLEALASNLPDEQGRLGAPDQLEGKIAAWPALGRFSGYVVVDPKGKIVSDFPKVDGRRGSLVNDREYLQASRAELKTQRSQALVGRFTQVPMFTLTTPIFYEQHLLGFLVGYQRLEQEPLFEEIRREFQEFSSELKIIEQVNQLIVSSRDPGQVFQPLPEVSKGSLIYQLKNQQLQGYYRDVSGKAWIYAASEIPGMDWLLVKQQPREPLLQPLQALLNHYLTNLLLLLILVSVLLFILLSWLLAPVYKGLAYLREVLSGQTDNLNLPEKGPEDIRNLFRAFNELQRLRNEQDKVKEDFISVVSHELRTPLTSIKGALAVLKSGAYNPNSTPEEQQLLEMADRNTKRLLYLVNDLLDLSSVSCGQLRLEMKNLDLEPLITQALEDFKSYAQERSIHFHCDPEEAPWVVYADSERLLQIINNLLSNAVKFSARTAPVDLRVEKKDNMIRISVKDHGDGIPLAFQPRVFERFAQAGGLRPGIEKGTGLGLAITRELVRAMQGQIGFYSAPGRGSCFYLDLIPAEVP